VKHAAEIQVCTKRLDTSGRREVTGSQRGALQCCSEVSSLVQQPDTSQRAAVAPADAVTLVDEVEMRIKVNDVDRLLVGERRDRLPS
jgi:hypothetical protein